MSRSSDNCVRFNNKGEYTKNDLGVILDKHDYVTNQLRKYEKKIKKS